MTIDHISRRRLLIGVSALAATPLLLSRTAWAAGAITAAARWPTGNSTLAPLVFDGTTIYAAGDKALERWELGASKPVWSRTNPGRGGFSARLAKTTVVNCSRFFLEGLSRDDGRVLWTYPNKGEIAGPLVTEEMICFGDGDEYVALDVNTGAKLWSFKAVKEGATFTYQAAAKDGMLHIGCGDGYNYGVVARTGGLVYRHEGWTRWQYIRHFKFSGDHLVGGGYLDNMFGFDPRTGEVAWEFYAGNFINTFTLHGGDVLFWSIAMGIVCLDAATGKVKWKHKTPLDFSNQDKVGGWHQIMAPIEADDRHVFVLDLLNIMHVLDRTTGERVARIPLSGIDPRPFFTLWNDSRQLITATKAGELLVADIRL